MSKVRSLRVPLTLNLLTTTIVAPPSNANKWQMGFNSAFKGLNAGISLTNLKPVNFLRRNLLQRVSQ